MRVCIRKQFGPNKDLLGWEQCAFVIKYNHRAQRQVSRIVQFIRLNTEPLEQSSPENIRFLILTNTNTLWDKRN